MPALSQSQWINWFCRSYYKIYNSYGLKIRFFNLIFGEGILLWLILKQQFCAWFGSKRTKKIAITCRAPYMVCTSVPTGAVPIFTSIFCPAWMWKWNLADGIAMWLTEQLQFMFWLDMAYGWLFNNYLMHMRTHLHMLS